ncbi:dATP/dGTP diphosphohydrolase domain-containing protein [Thiomicrorhabdus sp.]|uniref:dATP/dGTP diphosphohydrolase domain-containing protein n=1 Tax=Thiomicrorhabdus sp. TaxID=2039724 RepID=UPI0029C64BED|nr:dATP/dGTP diphosphohydrolase domain-containing protein [Thiomicrorhabdus sp.]
MMLIEHLLDNLLPKQSLSPCDIGLNEGVKSDDGKAMFSLIPPHALHQVAQVLTFGAKKYEPENWRKVPNANQRYLDAALRHLNAHQQGEKTDSESGLPHLAHATCCLLFLLELSQPNMG